MSSTHPTLRTRLRALHLSWWLLAAFTASLGLPLAPPAVQAQSDMRSPKKPSAKKKKKRKLKKRKLKKRDVKKRKKPVRKKPRKAPRKQRRREPRPDGELKQREERPPARKGALKKDARTADSDMAGMDPNAEIVREGDNEVKVMSFGGLDVEGRLKSPQLLYFVNRVRAEFDRPALPHRSFMPELSRSTHEDALR